MQHANELLATSNSHRLLTLFNEAINVYMNMPNLNKQIQQYAKNPNKETVKRNCRKMFGEFIKDFI